LQPLSPRARHRDPRRPAQPQGQLPINLADPTLPAAAVIAALGLAPHPEGGHFRETWRDAPADGSRGAGTAILFLLAEGDSSHWHRVDAAELWIWQAGAPLELRTPAATTILGPNLAAGHALQGIVPAHAWQAARPLGGWSLVTCTVSPAFRFEGFELAPPGWSPPPE
jgi:predicted cupin superfamily sugar epimerase